MEKTKIVLVDDHNVVREGISASLQKEDNFIVIGEADSGRAAVEFVSSSTPDIVIMDISMSDLNGIEATKQILSINSKIKVIALSMYSDKAYVLGMINAGVSGYLIKSCSHFELLDAIKTVLSGEMYLCAEAASIVVKSSLESSKNQKQGKRPSLLSMREKEVLELLSEGNTANSIAKKLYISPRTVNGHTSNIKKKLGITSIAELTKYAISKGITSLDRS